METEKRTVVYKLKAGIESVEESTNYDVSIWKPSLVNIYPPNKNFRYVIYWLFHWLKVFRNKRYASGMILDGEKMVSSLLVVPTHFKWPFMGKDDVQFTYVMTNSEYRGRGLAKKMIQIMISELNHDVDSFWYVTDTENKASISVAEKLGFEFVGYAERKGLLRILKLKH